MQFFLDTANVDEIASLVPTGLVDGVTTNPSLIAESGQPILPTLEKICALVKGPVSAEVVATDFDGMLREADVLNQIANNIVIKLPLTFDGLRAAQHLKTNNRLTNVTLCFGAAQGLAAMKSGATFLSPFLGRLDQNGGDGGQLLADLVKIKQTYGFQTKILAASIRSVEAVDLAARLGADCATFKAEIFRDMIDHRLTRDGLEAFLKTWAATGQHIAPPATADDAASAGDAVNNGQSETGLG